MVIDFLIIFFSLVKKKSKCYFKRYPKLSFKNVFGTNDFEEYKKYIKFTFSSVNTIIVCFKLNLKKKRAQITKKQFLSLK